jgi:nifR3 family TIM-barrel protein
LVTLKHLFLPDRALILAPMEDITDSPFRSICRRFGADLVVSEFVSSEGLIRDAVKSRSKLAFGEDERPVALQIFGHSVYSMQKAAEMAMEFAPDLLDLNFGCPVRKIVKKGAGAALLKDIPLMLQMTGAVVNAVDLPVTVKTRTGWDAGDQPIVQLAEQLQDRGIAAISIHGRTAVQLYGGQADWSLIGEVRQNPRMHIPVFGNGDVTNPLTAKMRFDQTGVDGILIGRGAIGNPWVFRDIRAYLTRGMIPEQPSLDERLEVLRSHFSRSTALKGEHRGVVEFRKFYSGYFRGMPGLKPYRIRLVKAAGRTEVEGILEEIRKKPPAVQGNLAGDSNPLCGKSPL